MATREELFNLGDRHREQGELEEALTQYLAALDLDPDYALAHAAAARMLTKLKRHAEALVHAQRVCELEPNDPFSFTALSVTCQQAGKIYEAEEAMAKARSMG